MSLAALRSLYLSEVSFGISEVIFSLTFAFSNKILSPPDGSYLCYPKNARTMFIAPEMSLSSIVFGIEKAGGYSDNLVSLRLTDQAG